jgi:hypothetical protein
VRPGRVKKLPFFIGNTGECRIFTYYARFLFGNPSKSHKTQRLFSADLYCIGLILETGLHPAAAIYGCPVSGFAAFGAMGVVLETRSASLLSVFNDFQEGVLRI